MKTLQAFELFGYVGRALLTGKDVAAGFLMQRGAHTLKALVGGDLLEAEKKGGNDRVQLVGEFNVGITCNADLNIRLEGDTDAWRRRLLVIKYEKAPPAKRITDFAEQLLAEEGEGILRWMVDGAKALLADLEEKGDYILTDEQKARVNNLMDESDSVRVFVQQRIRREPGRSITCADLEGEYYVFCDERNWIPQGERQVRSDLLKKMAEIHRVRQSHDIGHGMGQVRGYRGVAIIERGYTDGAEHHRA